MHVIPVTVPSLNDRLCEHVGTCASDVRGICASGVTGTGANGSLPQGDNRQRGLTTDDKHDIEFARSAPVDHIMQGGFETVGFGQAIERIRIVDNKAMGLIVGHHPSDSFDPWTRVRGNLGFILLLMT